MGTTDVDTRRSIIGSTLDDLSSALSEDGAALRVLAVDEDTPSVELELALDDADCADCILPPDKLRATVAAALQRATGDAVAVVLHDPRDSVADASPTAAAVTPGRLVVLDPTGVAPDDGEADTGADVGPLAGKTVAIRHDVLWPAFDWTVDEWTRSLEQAGATVLTWKRAQGLKDAELQAADADYEAMLARADAAISGLANCGSCTSWSVRDALLAAAKGVPTTVVATAHFEALARLLAAEGGRPGLRVTVLPYPYSTLPEPVVREHARNAFGQLADVLGATV